MSENRYDVDWRLFDGWCAQYGLEDCSSVENERLFIVAHFTTEKLGVIAMKAYQSGLVSVFYGVGDDLHISIRETIHG